MGNGTFGRGARGENSKCSPNGMESGGKTRTAKARAGAGQGARTLARADKGAMLGQEGVASLEEGQEEGAVGGPPQQSKALHMGI